MNPVYLILYIVAVPSTVILILQTVLLLFGLGHGADADSDFDHDFDHDLDHDFDHDGGFIDIDHDGIPDSVDHDVNIGHHLAGHAHDGGLRLLTVRGIVAFFAVGGWAGIAALELGAPNWLAVLAAALLGLAALVLVALFFKWALSMQSNGTLDLNNAVGCTGEVYMTVPANNSGRGKINVVIQERYTEMDAVTKCDRDLKYGESVSVIAMADNNTAVVEPVRVTATVS